MTTDDPLHLSRLFSTRLRCNLPKDTVPANSVTYDVGLFASTPAPKRCALCDLRTPRHLSPKHAGASP